MFVFPSKMHSIYMKVSHETTMLYCRRNGTYIKLIHAVLFTKHTANISNTGKHCRTYIFTVSTIYFSLKFITMTIDKMLLRVTKLRRANLKTSSRAYGGIYSLNSKKGIRNQFASMKLLLRQTSKIFQK